MSFLFIDSTYDVTLGILDEEMDWVDLRRHKGLKASTIIQAEVFDLFRKHSIDPRGLGAVIFVNGPGFYTGLRLSEGFSDVFEFFGVPHYSFYSYEVPRWCGVEKGRWFTKAYRGEYFLHDWDGEGQRSRLLSSTELPTMEPCERYFIHSETSLDELSSKFVPDPVQTVDLLREQPKAIFQQVLGQGLRREVFYFRAPEDEFKVST